MKGFANQYHMEFPNQRVLMINDISLVQGGRFDVKGNWNPPHKTHTRGKDVDFRLRYIDVDKRMRVKEICVANEVVREIHNGNHFHIDVP